MIQCFSHSGGGESSINTTMGIDRSCGAIDCPSKIEKFSNRTSSKVVDSESVKILMSIFSGAIFLSGVFIIIFVDGIKTEKDGERISIKSQCSAVVKMSFKDKRMLFLLPIQIYAGLLPGFVAVDFSKVLVYFFNKFLYNCLLGYYL